MSVTAILYVNDVSASSNQLQAIFDWTSQHGGPDFEMLGDSEGRTILYLHRIDTDHNHGTLEPGEGPVGNGVNFYVQVDDLEGSLGKAKKAGAKITIEPHINAGSKQKEFALRDRNGFHFVVTTWGNN